MTASFKPSKSHTLIGAQKKIKILKSQQAEESLKTYRAVNNLSQKINELNEKIDSKLRDKVSYPVKRQIHEIKAVKFKNRPGFDASVREINRHVKIDNLMHAAISNAIDALAVRSALYHETNITKSKWENIKNKGVSEKLKIINSTEFKSISDACLFLKLNTEDVIKQIVNEEIFAVAVETEEKFKIPYWSLDENFYEIFRGKKFLCSNRVDFWYKYHFLKTQNGNLHGMTPIDCLVSEKNINESNLHKKKAVIKNLDMKFDGKIENFINELFLNRIEEVLG